jgi:hypothetical protein
LILSSPLSLLEWAVKIAPPLLRDGSLFAIVGDFFFSSHFSGIDDAMEEVC